MTKKDKKDTPTVAKQTVFIAAVTYVLGLFAGVGLTVHKTYSTACIASNSNQNINYAQKAKALEAEVMNSPQNTSN